MGQTAAYMFDAVRAVVQDGDRNDRRLTQSTVEGWIGGWYRHPQSQPKQPIFPGAHRRPTDDALAAWNAAWEAATQAGGSHLQPPYNIITGGRNPAESTRVRTTRRRRRRPHGPRCGGVQCAATTDGPYEDVKAALRKLVLRFHPDREDASLTTEEKKRIFQAQYPAWTTAANRLYPGIAKPGFGFVARSARSARQLRVNLP